MSEVRSAHKHSRLLHKVEIVQDEPVVTSVSAVEVMAEPEPLLEMSGGDMLGMSIEGEESGGGKLMWLMAGSLAVIAGLVVGAVIYFSRTKMTLPVVDPTAQTPTPAVSPVVTVATTPTPTPSAKPDISKLKVKVLNGSGKKGEANVVAGLLTKAGFKDIDTGNAAKFDHTLTLIESKEEIPAELLKALAPYKTDTGDASAKLSKDSKYDIVITVGKTKSDQPDL